MNTRLSRILEFSGTQYWKRVLVVREQETSESQDVNSLTDSMEPGWMRGREKTVKFITWKFLLRSSCKLLESKRKSLNLRMKGSVPIWSRTILVSINYVNFMVAHLALWKLKIKKQISMQIVPKSNWFQTCRLHAVRHSTKNYYYRWRLHSLKQCAQNYSK